MIKRNIYLGCGIIIMKSIKIFKDDVFKPSVKTPGLMKTGNPEVFLVDTVKVEMDFPKDVLVAANIPEKTAAQEIKKVLALYLFKENGLSFGKACELSGLSHREFIELLGKQGIPLHYDINDYEEDLKTIRSIDYDNCIQHDSLIKPYKDL